MAVSASPQPERQAFGESGAEAPTVGHLFVNALRPQECAFEHPQGDSSDEQADTPSAQRPFSRDAATKNEANPASTMTQSPRMAGHRCLRCSSHSDTCMTAFLRTMRATMT